MKRLVRVRTTGEDAGPSLVPHHRGGPISTYHGNVKPAGDAVVATRARMRGQPPKKTLWRRILGRE
jgi:hypothetical protein